jgi:hypothetical protein
LVAAAVQSLQEVAHGEPLLPDFVVLETVCFQVNLDDGFAADNVRSSHKEKMKMRADRD